MAGAEGYRPFQPQGVRIPLEKVGVRGSERRPGERRLHLLRPPEPEPQKTLLQEMQQYVTTRQSLREHGYFAAMGKEPRDIVPADAIDNDLVALTHDSSLPDNAQAIRDKGNIIRMQEVFNTFAFSQFSPQKQQEIYEGWERIRQISNRRERQQVVSLTGQEVDATIWLIERVGGNSEPLKTQKDGYSFNLSSSLWQMRITNTLYAGG